MKDCGNVISGSNLNNHATMDNPYPYVKVALDSVSRPAV